MKDILDRAIAYVRDLYAREPARVNAAVLAALTAVGLPLVVGGVDAGPVIALVLLVLLGGEGTRSVVYAPKNVDKLVRDAKRS